jgi:putative two-component system response regulator
LSVPDGDAWLIGQAAPLHDVGKLATPDAILQKSIGLTRDEIAVMNTHCTIGASILSAGHSPLLQLAEVIALTHHERWDGTGYPTGLAGEDIPLAGRIVAVADAFDAMTHPRPYRMLAYSVEKAFDVISGLSGQQFDPAVVEALKSVLSQSPGVADDGVATDH